MGTVVALLAAALATGLLAGPRAGAEGRQDGLSELVRLNAEAVFGAPVKVEGDRFSVTLSDNRQFGKLFKISSRRGPGIASHKDEVASEVIRKRLTEGAAGKFSAAGVGSGSAVSTFEVEDEVAVKFLLRIPLLEPNAQLAWKLFADGRGTFVETDFFRAWRQVTKGRTRARALTPLRRLRAPPKHWFDTRSAGVPVEIHFREGTARARMHLSPVDPQAEHPPRQGRNGRRGRSGKKDKAPESAEVNMADLVELAGIDEPRSGRLALEFASVDFLLSDLTIEGRYAKEWAAARIDALRGQGKLRTPEEAAREATKETARPPRVARPSAKEPPDLSRPDPEAEEDL